MIDDAIRSEISRKLRKGRDKYRFLTLAGAYLSGVATAAIIIVIALPRLSDDEMGKLAALAALSTDQPAAVLWIKAEGNMGWGWQRLTAAKRLLVDVNVDRCSVRQAFDGHGNQTVPLVADPGDRYYR